MGIILYTFYAKWSMETQWYIHLQRVDQLYFVFSSYIRNGMHYSLGVCLSIIPSALAFPRPKSLRSPQFLTAEK